jgi:hypothetical protein
MKSLITFFLLALLSINARGESIIFQTSNWNLSGTNAMTNTIRVTQVGQIIGGQGIQVGLPINLSTTNGFITNAFLIGNYSLSILNGAPYPYNGVLYFQSLDNTTTNFVNFTNRWLSGGDIFVSQPGPVGPAGQSNCVQITNGVATNLTINGGTISSISGGLAITTNQNGSGTMQVNITGTPGTNVGFLNAPLVVTANNGSDHVLGLQNTDPHQFTTVNFVTDDQNVGAIGPGNSLNNIYPNTMMIEDDTPAHNGVWLADGNGNVLAGGLYNRNFVWTTGATHSTNGLAITTVITPSGSISNAGSLTFGGTANGNGSGLTSLNASAISAGTVPTNNEFGLLPALANSNGIGLTNLSGSNFLPQGANSIFGNGTGSATQPGGTTNGSYIVNTLTGQQFVGGGAGLTALNGSSISSGTVATNYLPAALAALAANNGVNLTGFTAGQIPNLPGSIITSGTINQARIPQDGTTITNSGGNLTAGTNVALYNASGTFGGTQTFGNMTVNGTIAGTAVVPLANGGTGNAVGYAQGFTNGLLPMYFSNNNNYPTLVVPLTPAQSSNTTFNNQIQVFSGISSYGSSVGFTYPLIGTNFVSGAQNLWSTNIDPVTGLAVTNYIQNAGNMFQVGQVPLQSGTNKTINSSPNIGQGWAQAWSPAQPYFIGGFSSGHQIAGMVYEPSNVTFYFNPVIPTNYDGRGDNFAKSYVIFDGVHTNVALTNLLQFQVSAQNFTLDSFGDFASTLGGNVYFNSSKAQFTNLVLNQAGNTGGSDFTPVISIPNAAGTSGGWTEGLRDDSGHSLYWGTDSTVMLQLAGDSSAVQSLVPLLANSGTFTNGIVGNTASNNPPAGNVGELVQTLVAQGSAVTCSTGVVTNVAQVILTAGDWDVEGNVNFTNASATVTQEVAGIWPTTLSASGIPTDGSEVISGVLSTVVTGADSITLPRKRINTSVTTTNYLAAKSTFSAGTVKAYGQISARRVR